MSHLASRRSFLGRLGGAAAAAASLSELKPLLAATAGEESRWNLVRQQFSFSEDKVPMNAANLCPSPRAVTEQVASLTKDIDFDCSFNNRGKFSGLLEKSRRAVAAQIGADPGEVALVRNTSEANNTINAGLPLKAGDEVLLWEQNHPTNNVAWEVRAKRHGFSVRKVPVPKQPGSEAELVDAFINALSPKTRVLSITHISNVSGIRLPAKQIIAEARKRGVYVHLDGAQSWGIAELDLHDLGCDSYSASSHKWFCGPREVGLLYVRKERIAEIWPRIVAPGWGTTAETVLKGARKFENFGHRDDRGIPQYARGRGHRGPCLPLGHGSQRGTQGRRREARHTHGFQGQQRRLHHRGAGGEPRQGQRRDVSQARDCVLEHGRPAAVSAPLQHHRTR